MDLILIRHPAVAVEAGVCYGRSDVPLEGEPQACVSALASRFAQLEVPAPDVTLTSPLGRCASVAESWAAYCGCQWRTDPRLQEMDFGAWEQQRWDAIDRALLDEWAADLQHARAHGGESVAQLSARVQEWFDDMQAQTDGACVHVVTHAGVIRVLASIALGIPLDRCLSWSVDFARVAWLRGDDATGQWALVRWNA
jgi:alpha-ribazole phosphatase